MPETTKTRRPHRSSSTAGRTDPTAKDLPPGSLGAKRREDPRASGATPGTTCGATRFFLVSAVLVLLLLLIVVFPGLFTSASPRSGDLTHHYLTSPQWAKFFAAEWFGYDGQGRSVYARVIYGTRASIIVGIVHHHRGDHRRRHARHDGGLLRRLARRAAVPSHRHLLRHPVPARCDGRAHAFTRPHGVPVIIGALAFLGWTQIARVMRGCGDHRQAGRLRASRRRRSARAPPAS